MTITSFKYGLIKSNFSKMDAHRYILLYAIHLFTYHFVQYWRWFGGKLSERSFQNWSKKRKVPILADYIFNFACVEASGQSSPRMEKSLFEPLLES